MTRKLALPTCFALAMMNLLFVSQATAHDEEAVRIFRECASEIRQTARRCVNQNENTTDRCVAIIRELLAHGQFERARRVANHCIEVIQNRSEECVDRINEICRRCVRALLNHDAERLARLLRDEVCKDARTAVVRSARRSIRRIENLFD